MTNLEHEKRTNDITKQIKLLKKLTEDGSLQQRLAIGRQVKLLESLLDEHKLSYHQLVYGSEEIK